jgi:hypothetical protein
MEGIVIGLKIGLEITKEKEKAKTSLFQALQHPLAAKPPHPQKAQ